MTTGLPDEDLSDLGTPTRGTGLRDFFDTAGAPEADPAQHQEPSRELPRPREQQHEEPAAQEPTEVDPDDDQLLSPGTSTEPQRRSARRNGPGTATIYMSESVRARLTAYRKKHDTTNLVVVFQAIESCGKLGQLGKSIS